MVWSLFSASTGTALRGERIRLREPRLSDYGQWKATRQNSRDFLQPWEPQWSAKEFDATAFRERIRHYRRERDSGVAHTFFIELLETGELAGGITVGKVQHGVADSCELGYWMGAGQAGRGYMREALRLVIDHVFNTLGLHRIEAACIPENQRSVRLLEKAGFVREGVMRGYLRINGVWRDHYLYALLKEDRTGGRT